MHNLYLEIIDVLKNAAFDIRAILHDKISSILGFDKTLNEKTNPLELNHKQIVVSARISRTTESVEFVNSFFVDLVKRINMVVLHGPFSTFCDTVGNIGVTGIVCIETSHSSIHTQTCI